MTDKTPGRWNRKQTGKCEKSLRETSHDWLHWILHTPNSRRFYIELSDGNFILCLLHGTFEMQKTFCYCVVQSAFHSTSLARYFRCLGLTPLPLTVFGTGHVIGSWRKTTLLLAKSWQYRQFINLKRANNAWCSTKLKVIVGLGLSSL